MTVFYTKSDKKTAPRYIKSKDLLQVLEKMFNKGVVTRSDNDTMWHCGGDFIWKEMSYRQFHEQLKILAETEECRDYLQDKTIREAFTDIKSMTLDKTETGVFEQSQKDFAHIIAFENTFFDVKKMKFIEPKAHYYRLVKVPIIIDTNKPLDEYECPMWLDALSYIYEDDESRINLLQEIFGYNFLSDNRFHKFVCLIGPGGNGKSFIEKIMRATLNGCVDSNKNTSAVGLDKLGQDHYSTVLVNKKANISDETSRSLEKSIQTIKTITSGDPVVINPKNQAMFTTILPTKIIASMNDTPYFGEDTMALKQRAVIIPHNVIIRGTEKEDNMLAQKIMDAGELQGIIGWSMEGLKRALENNGFTYSEAVEKTYKRIQVENDPVRRFAEDMVMFTEEKEDHLFFSDINQMWTDWAMENAVEKKPARFFIRLTKLNEGKSYETRNQRHPNSASRSKCLTHMRVKTAADEMNERVNSYDASLPASKIPF